MLAVVVVRDGATWLDEVLSALLAQDYADLDVVVVDNGSRDASRDLAIARVGAERVLAGDLGLGFGQAVELGMIARPDAPLVLLVHDDLVLAPDAVSALVEGIRHDPVVAVVGPKLVGMDDHTLQSVGWSIDGTGRVVTPIGPDEWDQGQHDAVRRPLAVSTAGMLMRRDVYEDLSGFDPRYRLFREDLDYCWRVWLAGWEVEVRPGAVGRHARAAANFTRVDSSLLRGARYYAERHTLATLIKNYSGVRLISQLLVFFSVGLAKIVGFVATRRVSDAAQTLRAWGWNVSNLPGTWRRRRRSQARRRRSDAELAGLLARVGPRFRAYFEAVADWLTGGAAVGVIEAPPIDPDDPPTVRERVVSLVRRRPVAVASSLMLLVGVAVSLPLIGTEVLRGGELSAFPTSPRLLFEDYVASWHDARGVGTNLAPSPSSAILAAVQTLALGSAWAASRAVVVLAVPIAWFLSLRAARWLTPARGPRVAVATLYALSPPVMAAFRTGRLSGLVAAIALPGLLSTLPSLVRGDVVSSRAWRGAAGAALFLALAVSFEPALVPVAAAVLTVLAVVALRRGGRRGMYRVVLTGVASAALCFPWSLRWIGANTPVFDPLTDPSSVSSSLWRWLLLSPDAVGFPRAPAGIGYAVAAAFGVFVVVRIRSAPVVAGWGAVLLGAVGAAVADRAGVSSPIWPGTAALVTAAGFAALLGLGLARVGVWLGDHDFGWRQLLSGVAVATASLGVAFTVVPAVFNDTAYTQGTTAVPQFLAAEAAGSTERLLTVRPDPDGSIDWEMTTADGGSLLGHGVHFPSAIRSQVNLALADILSGSDPGAGARLGLLNVGHVYVPPGDLASDVADDFAAQLDLQPRALEDGALFRVVGVVSRVSFAPPEAIASIRTRGAPGNGAPLIAFDASPGARWTGAAPRDGSVLVSEASAPGWEAVTDTGAVLERRTTSGLVRFDVQETTAQVTVSYGRQAARTLAVSLQVLALLLTLSVLLRPPGSGLPKGLR